MKNILTPLARLKSRSVSLAMFLGALILASLSPASSANLEASGGIAWRGVTLSEVGGFSQSILPVNSDGTIEWAIYFGTQCSGSGTPVTASDTCFEVQLLPTGLVSFSDLLATSSENKTLQDAQCTWKTTNPFSASFAGETDCWTKFAFSEGQKYTFTVRKTSSTPGSWWLATVKAGDTGSVISIGEIRHDSLPPSTHLYDRVLSITHNSIPVTYANCDLVPNVVTIFGLPVNDIPSQGVALDYDYGVCALRSFSTLTDGSNAVRFNYGGNGNQGATLTPTPSVTSPAPPIMSANNSKYSIIGKIFSLTVVIPTSANRAFLVSQILGYPSDFPLEATIKNGLAHFSFKLADKSFGLKTRVNIYSSNNYGDSPSLNLSIEIPKEKNPVPAVKATPPAKISKAPSTPEQGLNPQIYCDKGSTTRLFIAAICPPGWTRG